jgi:hypothetical protein
MNNRPSFLSRILPFFMAIIMLGVFIMGFIILSWFLMIIAIIGGIFFLIGYIRFKLTKPKMKVNEKQHRIIEHDDTDAKQ